MGPFQLDRVVAQAALDGLVPLREGEQCMELALPLTSESVIGAILDALAEALRTGQRSATLLLCPFGAAIYASANTGSSCADNVAGSPGVSYELTVQLTTVHMQDAYLILAGVTPSEHARAVLPWARVPGFLEALQRVNAMNSSCAGADLLRLPLQPLAVPVIIQSVLDAGGTVEVVDGNSTQQ